MDATPARPRRTARIWAIVPIALLIAVIGFGVSIPLTNDAAARDVESHLIALPLPLGATLVDSMSVAAKVTGNGNGMQYLGALLIQSDQSLPELQSHYDHLESTGGLRPEVIATTDAQSVGEFHGAGGFFRTPGDPAQYIVSAFGEAPSSLHEEFDLRGH